MAGSNKEHRNASNVVASSPSVLPNFSSYGQEQQPLQSFGGPTHGQHGKSHSSPFPHLQQQHLHQVYYGHPTQQMIYRHPPPAPPIMSQATPSSSSYPSHVGHLPYPHQFHHSHLKQQLMSGSPSKQQRHNSKRGQAQQQQMICSRGAHMLPSHSVPSHRQETQKWLSPPKVPLLRRTSTQELKVLSVRSANKDNILIAEQQTPQSGVQLDSDLRTDSPCEIESMYFNNKENQLHTNNITATNSSSAKKRLVEMINEENRSLSFDSPRDKSSKKVDGRRTIKQLAKSSASSSTTPASFSNVSDWLPFFVRR